MTAGIRTPNLTAGNSLDEFIGNQNVGGQMVTRRVSRTDVLGSIESRLSTVETAPSLANITFGPVYGTLAALNADLAHAANTGATVQGDGANDGLYVKSGASGAGSWSRISTFSLPALASGLTAETTARTNADTALSAVLTNANSRVGELLRARATRIGVLGDSLQELNILASATYIQSRPYGAVNTFFQLYPFGEVDVWLNGSDSRGYKGMYHGKAGDKLEDMIARLDELFAWGPDQIWLFGGVNNVLHGDSAAFILSKIALIKARCDRRGIPLMVGTIPPMDTVANSSPGNGVNLGDAKRTELFNANASIRSTYQEMVADIWTALATTASPASDGVPKSGTTYDGLHWRTKGAYLAAGAIYNVAKMLLKGLSVHLDARINNLIPNGIFTTPSGGTLGAGVETAPGNNVPLGFILQRIGSGTATVSCSSTPNPKTGGNSLLLDFTQHAGGAGVELFRLSLSSAIPATPLIGKSARFHAGTVLQGWSGGAFAGWCNASSGVNPYSFCNEGGSPLDEEFIPAGVSNTRILPTESFTVPSSPTDLTPLVEFQIRGTGAGGSTGRAAIDYVALQLCDEPIAQHQI